MNVPTESVYLHEARAGSRHVNGAIEALQRGDFDLAVTLAAAADRVLSGSPEPYLRSLLDPAMPSNYGPGDGPAKCGKPKELTWLVSRDEAAREIMRAVAKLPVWSPEAGQFVHWFFETYLRTAAAKNDSTALA